MSHEIKQLSEFTDFENIFRNKFITALIFDFDKTVIENDSYQILYELLSGQDGEELYQQFLIDQKEMKFIDAHRKFENGVIDLLRSKGLATRENVTNITKYFVLREGVDQVISLAKQELGMRVIIISAGISIIRKFVEDKLPDVDKVYTNTEFFYEPVDNGGQVYKMHQYSDFSKYKVEQLIDATKLYNFKLSDAMIMGDSGYDTDMVQAVQNEGGIGIAVATNNIELRSVAMAEIESFNELLEYLTLYKNYLRSRELLPRRRVS